jgi:Zn finger protein HypA/HybF involved in hydrogenase expression
MRIKVVCNNCGIKWVRITCEASSLEYNDDLQHNCPKCSSNDYELQKIEQKEMKNGKFV